ncbi:MAG: SAM-dependent methyltransferase [Gammaproteobacteria bacterium]|nr:SAM-dependent methyltransferase [Gammaproteobacteria bacterium]
MRLALYAPNQGYYRCGLQKFGKHGDFITAPEISPLFSYCVARQCQQVLTELGGGDIVELGAGAGTLAVNVLEYLHKQDCLPEHYYILELSAELQARQQALIKKHLPDILPRVIWLNELPKNIEGVIFANEVADALPVRRFEWQKKLKEFFVDWRQDQFVPILESASEHLQDCFENLKLDLADGYQSELNCLFPGWIASLAESLNRGLILLIDYGFPEHEFYHPDRHMGTLMCHFQHHAHSEALIYPGIQDITAHVNFTQIARAGIEHELELVGYTHQSGFLLNCGISELLTDPGTVDYFQHTQAIKQLMMPTEMGELFKAIALTKNFDSDLLGFSEFDLRTKLRV